MPQKSFPRGLVITLVVALLVLVVGGGWFYRRQEQRLRHHEEENLQTIAQLKANQIVAWRAERLGDAGVLTENAFFADGVARWLANPQTTSPDDILTQFQSLQKQYHYSDVLLVDSEGRVRLSMSGQITPLHEEANQALASAWTDRQPMLTDLHAGPGDLPPHIDVIAPLFAGEDPGADRIGAVILQSDANQYLYPLIQTWPTASRSAETLLVRRDGDAVLFLNNLRHQPDAALTLRMPLSQTDLPAVMAIQGKEGVVWGKDYRGVEVLSAIQAVPDTPWFMIAKVDKLEVFADWRTRSALILALIPALLAAVGASGGVVWQRTQKVQYKSLFLAEKARQESEARYQTTLMSIGDGVIVTNAAGQVTLLNPVAEALTGWSRHDAREKPLGEIFPIINEDTRQPVDNPVSRVLSEQRVVGLANHTLLRSKTGREVPIADSGAPVHNDQGDLTGVVLVFRDQTIERVAQKALRESEARYRSLFEHMLNGFAFCKMIFDAEVPRDFIYLDVNRAFEAQTGLKNVIGKPVTEVIPGIRESDPELFEIYGRVARTGVPERFETYVEALQSWFSISVYSPETDYFVAVFDVITGRKQVEGILADERNLLRTLIDNVPDFIYAKDPEGRFVIANRGLARSMSVASPEDLIGKSDADFYPPSLVAPHVADELAIMRSGQPLFNQEEPLLDRSGTPIGWLSTSKVAWHDAAGRIIGVVGIGRDITERKQAADALRRHDAILKVVADISEQLLRINDLDAVLPEAVARLGRTANVSRVHIFENHRAPDGTLLTSCRFEWVAPHASMLIGTLSLQNVSYADGFERWVDLLSAGQPLYGLVRELPPSECAALKSQGIVSQATVPIFAGEVWWGFLGFDDCEREREWLPAEIEALRDVASTLGAALVRQQAEQAEREQRIMVDALSDTAAALTAKLDLNVVMRRILENADRVVPYDAANIMLIEGDHLRIACWRGYAPESELFLRGLDLPLSQVPSLQELVATGLPDQVPDINARPDWVTFPETAWIRSYLAVPIRVRDQVVGVLNLDSSTPGFFTQEHTRRLQALADQAGIAFESAQLYDEIRRHATTLEQRVIERTAELRTIKERIEAILNSTDDVMILCRTDGSIEQVNPAFDAAFQTTPDTMLGQRLSALVVPEQVALLEQALNAVIEARQPYRIELTTQYAGTKFDADVVLSPIVQQTGQLLGVVCTLRDITERKRMEARLRQMLHHEIEVNAMKSRFVSMASHQFRTPLAVIQTTTDILNQYGYRLSDEEKGQKLDQIQRKIAQMVDLLDDMLVIGRAEAGKLEFEPEPLDVVDLCQTLVADFQRAIGQDHDLSFTQSGDCAVIVADPNLLRNILDNLLSNAIKYSPQGSTVTLVLTCAAESVVFSVADQGIGIRPEDQKHLFEAFFRASNGSSVPGTGLGLAIVKQLVDLHGGTVTFTSQEGVGTTFSVVLPQLPARR